MLMSLLRSFVNMQKVYFTQPGFVTEHSRTAIGLIFVNNSHRIVLHGVQEFAASDHSIVFAIKKAGICKAPVEVREVRSFKRYNKTIL